MFQIHKKPQGDAAVKKSVQKILDPKKDTVTRLKHLRLVLENVSDPAEEQAIFEQYYSHIYYVFYENFLIAEANVRQKGAHRAQREELDNMLHIFEIILLHLPDMLHERWQYNSIDRIIKTLLHPGNSLKMRRDGVKFFLLWLRSLWENAKEETVLLYACIVPGFPAPPTKDGRYTNCTLKTLLNPVSEAQGGMCPAEIACLIPPSAGDNSPHDVTKFFLDTMLEFMVVEACKLQWKDKQTMNKTGFSFLWDMFKKFYLPHIFQDFRLNTSVYQPDLSLPEPREPVNYILNLTDTGSIDPCIEVGDGCPMLPARVSIIKWVVVFTSNTVRKENKNRAGRLSDMPLSTQTSHLNMPSSSQDQEASHSNASTLTEKAPSISSLSSLDDKLKSTNSVSEEEELVREVLYSSRENVNIVHEVFRQALMLPLTEAKTMRRVVKVYQEWIQDGLTPVFMEDPDFSVANEISEEKAVLVKAGCQTTYQLFITNSAHVFLVEPPNDAHRLIQAQVDVCKRVLNLYRHMVMHITMDNTTWTQLLQVLLHITRIMLQDADTPASIRVTTVAGRLAGPVFQTLIVSWIKANLFVHVSRELWDEIVDVLSSLMHWKDLIVEWAKNMDTMTRVLARHVYGLELSDLPLDRLTEQKLMKNRKGLEERLAKPAERSFSKGWSREAVHARSDLRMRSRTTALGTSTEHEPDNKSTPFLTINDNLQPLERTGRSITVLGLKSASETVPTRQNLSPTSDQAEHTGHLPLKRGKSDTSDFSSSSPPGLLAVRNENLQRSSSTSDITLEKIVEVYTEDSQNQYGWSNRQRCNSGPGYRERDDMDTVHGLRIRNDNDGMTSLSSVEDAFNNMFDELAQQRLSTVNPKLEVFGAQPDVVSVQSQDSGSIDPNWNPWAESNGLTGGDLEEPSHEQFIPAHGGKEMAGYSDLRDNDETEWGSCLEDHNYGEGDENEDHSSVRSDSSSTTNGYDFSSTTGMLPPQPAELLLTTNQEENLMNEFVNMLSNEQNTSSEAASPGLPSPPYQICKHDSRDRYDSTALLISESRRSAFRNEGRKSIADADEAVGDASDSEAMLEKSSDDILGVHYNNPQLALLRCGSGGVSDLTSDNDEDTAAQPNKTADSLIESCEDCSILAGGRRTGWYPDVAVALWRRLLGILGDVNQVKDPVIHQLIFTYLLKFWDVLFKLRQNLGITTDNASTLPPPELVPPLRIMAPWAFKAVMSLPESHKEGCLHAYQLLCNMTLLQNHDTRLEPEHLALFYMVLHEGLHSYQDKVNEIVESSCPKVFSCCLPASTLLLLDFLYACNSVAASTDLSGPRVEAQTILGSVLCFPNLYYDLPVLNPDSEEPKVLVCSNIKEYVADALLTSAKKEPSAPARCVALSSLGVWLYEELTSSVEENYPTLSTESAEGLAYDTNLSPVMGRILARHGRVKEAINVLLVSLKFSNRVVASVACSQLHLLTHCIAQLLEYMPEMLPRIIEVMSLTASSLLQSSEAKSSESGRQLLVSLLLCICDWCMVVPLPILIESTLPGSDKRLIRTVFKALQTGALGKPGHSAKHSYSLSDLASKDFDPNLQLDKVLENSSSSSTSFRNNTLTLPPMPNVSLGTDHVVSLTASTVLSHLTNHLGHFPLVKGPAVLNSLVTEQQDHGPPIDKLSGDLSRDLFNSPNVQFLIYNNSCLLSIVEIPAQRDIPVGGPTAGLPTAPTNVRLIVRDTSGKFCWDSSVLYGTPNVKEQTKPVLVTTLSTLDQEISRVVSKHCQSYISYAKEAQLQHKRGIAKTPLPSHDVSLDPEKVTDKLDQLLQYVGYSSPECQEYPGRPLNILSSVPKVIEVARIQEKALESLLQQHKSQSANYSANAHHSSCQSRSSRPLTYSPPQSPFHQARLLISQTAFLSKENRRRVTLLKKNEKLLRELKNLDSRSCRETHKVAVLYIAPGQEDKLSVLSNTAGSEEFENFVSCLGWEVDLKTHCGFRGKLHSDGSTGSTCPYYATSTLEVVFHVSTRFPSTNDDSRNIKLKHLGNDEVHIVWSEHGRDYRRGIIPTEFGDVLIIIYPMKHRLYRIQIKKKNEVPYFGPLFDGAVVNARVLPVLVRETAINAGRAKRSQISLYQPFYEERAKYLHQIIDQFRDDTTFEDYAAQLFSPAWGRTSSSPASKTIPKRPAPKPSPPMHPPHESLPSRTTVPSSVTPTPIVGKISPLAMQQSAPAANGNNNNNGSVTSSVTQDIATKKRHLSADSNSSAQSLSSAVKEPPIEKEAGPRYTPGHQITSSKGHPTAQSFQTALHLLSSKATSTHHFSTPRPKPAAPSHQSSISVLSFSQHQQQTPTNPTPMPVFGKIHIPVSKMQSSATKSASNAGPPGTPGRRHPSGHTNSASTSNSEVVLIPPPTSRSKSIQNTGSGNLRIHQQSLSVPSSPITLSAPVQYQNHLK